MRGRRLVWALEGDLFWVFIFCVSFLLTSRFVVSVMCAGGGIVRGARVLALARSFPSETPSPSWSCFQKHSTRNCRATVSCTATLCPQRTHPHLWR
ncbi:hypothetical protein C8F04DRAFT_705163 [Mycena alexandri]|uniref:Uncharacterized protein n=1 Tax=Mycena alexandri TaxID=1745969 RepID=A0AAD6SRL3_9AGAR|nr:hypothetical protein C8F04DRAFT_705163 [Mycena alexandri]